MRIFFFSTQNLYKCTSTKCFTQFYGQHTIHVIFGNRFVLFFDKCSNNFFLRLSCKNCKCMLASCTHFFKEMDLYLSNVKSIFDSVANSIHFLNILITLTVLSENPMMQSNCDYKSQNQSIFPKMLYTLIFFLLRKIKFSTF